MKDRNRLRPEEISLRHASPPVPGGRNAKSGGHYRTKPALLAARGGGSLLAAGGHGRRVDRPE